MVELRCTVMPSRYDIYMDDEKVGVYDINVNEHQPIFDHKELKKRSKNFLKLFPHGLYEDEMYDMSVAYKQAPVFGMIHELKKYKWLDI